MSVNRCEKLLKLTNQKCLADGSVLKKIERFSEQGVERKISKDGQMIARIIPRLNTWKDPENWLSMQPSQQGIQNQNGKFFAGEFSQDNVLHGGGI